MKNRIFHSIEIGGYKLDGRMASDGPYLACEKLRRGVALGVCALRKFEPTDIMGRTLPSGWWVVKYSTEACIDLHHFSDVQARVVSDEFGIVILDGYPPSEHVRQEYFFTSPAADGLRDWVKKHPNIAKSEATNQRYLFNWYERTKAI